MPDTCPIVPAPFVWRKPLMTPVTDGRQMAGCPPTRGALASSDVSDNSVQQAAEGLVGAGRDEPSTHARSPRSFI